LGDTALNNRVGCALAALLKIAGNLAVAAQYTEVLRSLYRSAVRREPANRHDVIRPTELDAATTPLKHNSAAVLADNLSLSS